MEGRLIRDGYESTKPLTLYLKPREETDTRVVKIHRLRCGNARPDICPHGPQIQLFTRQRGVSQTSTKHSTCAPLQVVGKREFLAQLLTANFWPIQGTPRGLPRVYFHSVPREQISAIDTWHKAPYARCHWLRKTDSSLVRLARNILQYSPQWGGNN